MAQQRPQTCLYNPNLTIDCMLTNVSRQLEADGRVLQFSEARCTLATPDHLTPGDFVKVRLWLENEEASIDIRLAEVRRIHKHWITAEVIQMSQNDRIRLKRLVDARAAMHQEQPAPIHHLLIRA
jgi:hypothetical protein